MGGEGGEADEMDGKMIETIGHFRNIDKQYAAYTIAEHCFTISLSKYTGMKEKV